MNKASSVMRCVDQHNSYHAVIAYRNAQHVDCFLMSCEQSAKMFARVNKGMRCKHHEVHSKYCDVRNRWVTQEFLAYLPKRNAVYSLWDATTLKLFIAHAAMEHPEFQETLSLPNDVSNNFQRIFQDADRLIDREVSSIAFRDGDEDYYIFRCTYEGPDTSNASFFKIESSRLAYEETWLD